LTIRVIVLPVDPNQRIRLQQLDPHNLDTQRALVGGSLQILHLERPEAAIYLNEAGKLNRLRVNHRATTLAWVHNSAFRGRDVIVGPAYVVGPTNRHGYDGSAPDDLVELLLHTERYRVQVQTNNRPEWNGNELVFTDWLEAYGYGVDLAQRWTVVDEVRVVPELASELREQWYQLGMTNPWVKAADDPPFTRNSFVGCFSVDELAERITAVSWTIGTAFYYRDLCFIQQVEGGDEWLTIRHGVAFESMTLTPYVEDGSFPELIRRLLAATKGQCERLTY
jgi:uncharacterized protein DUF3846